MNQSKEVAFFAKEKGSVCGSVGRVVAPNSRGLRFKSRNRQNLNIQHRFTVKSCIEKTKIKKERQGMAHFFKKEYRNLKTLSLALFSLLQKKLHHLVVLSIVFFVRYEMT